MKMATKPWKSRTEDVIVVAALTLIAAILINARWAPAWGLEGGLKCDACILSTICLAMFWFLLSYLVHIMSLCLIYGGEEASSRHSTWLFSSRWCCVFSSYLPIFLSLVHDTEWLFCFTYVTSTLISSFVAYELLFAEQGNRHCGLFCCHLLRGTT